MYRPAISTILFVAFTISVVIGLCAVTTQEVAHDGICTADGIGFLICPSNSMRSFGFLAIVLMAFAATSRFHIVGTRPFGVADALINRSNERESLAWVSLTSLRPLFSEGILNSKAY